MRDPNVSSSYKPWWTSLTEPVIYWCSVSSHTSSSETHTHMTASRLCVCVVLGVFYLNILRKSSTTSERVKKTNGAHWANGMLKRHISDAGAGVKTMPAFYPRRALIGRETVPPWHSVGESEGQKNCGTETRPTPPALVPWHHLAQSASKIVITSAWVLDCVSLMFNNTNLECTHGSLVILIKPELASKCKKIS